MNELTRTLSGHVATQQDPNQIHHGTSTRHCQGMCVSTKDCGMSHGIMLMTAIPVTMFCVFVAPSVHAVCVVVAVILYVAMYAVAAVGANSDPGIVPPSLVEPEPMDPSVAVPGVVLQEPRSLRGVTLHIRDVVEPIGINKDNLYIRRYCHTCKIVRPPGASHCPACDYCVKGFDHHCGVLGICVGERTWRHFTWFIILAVVHCMFIFSVSMYSVTTTTYETTQYGQWLRLCTIGLIIFTSCIGMSLSGLAGNYIQMTITNNTQRDGTHTRHHDAYWDDSKGNPFDEGCKENCYIKMCRVTESVV